MMCSEMFSEMLRSEYRENYCDDWDEDDEENYYYRELRREHIAKQRELEAAKHPLRISIPPIYGAERKDVLKILGRRETECSMFYSFEKHATVEKIDELLCYIMENPDFLEYYPTFRSILLLKIKELPMKHHYWRPLKRVVNAFLALCDSIGTDEYKATLGYHQFWEDYWVWAPNPKFHS
jgi:hypothetical protein